MHAAQTVKIPRYKDHPYYNQVIGQFKSRGVNGRWHGAKMVLNPGIDALDWIWIPKKFPKSKIVFITRDPEKNYASYYKADKNTARGVISKEAYVSIHKQLTDRFIQWNKNHKSRSCFLKYENILSDADRELSKVWKLLNIEPLTGMQKFIKKPRN